MAEKRILESEIKAIVDPKSKRTPLRPLELSQRFDSFSEMNCYGASSYDLQMSPSNFSSLLDILPPTPCNTIESSIPGGQENKPLDRKRNEMKENLLVLEVEISSASGELQKLKAEQDELTPLAAIQGRICNRCHQSGHTKTTCKSRPCESSNNCRI